MALTGLPGRHTGPPAGLIAWLDSIAPTLGISEPLSLLTERAAISGLTPRGDISCGGACRILPCADGHIAASLPRPEDIEVLPAWLEMPVDPDDPWATLTQAVAERRASDLVEHAVLVQLAVSALGEAHPGEFPAVIRHGTASPVSDLTGITVVELGSLWAGPLCGRLLRERGARVIKVESTTRPDGAREGPKAFFDLLNAHKDCVALDFRSREGLAALRGLLTFADVVIEGSRPRALEQLGFDAPSLVSDAARRPDSGPRVWISITAHGRTGPEAQRVGFGDDAAVAGGLVCGTDDRPVFCMDAIADPLSGMVSAASCIEALATGTRCLIDVPMARIAACCAGSVLEVPPHLVATSPRIPRPDESAHALGEDTRRVLSELEIET